MDTKGVHNYQTQPQAPDPGFVQPSQPPSYEQTYPPVQQAYTPVQQPYPAVQQTYQPVHTQQPVQVTQIITTAHVGPNPINTRCPSCQADIQTRVDYESSSKTHLFALLCCLFCWPCVWVPYVIDSCKNANHYCPACGSFIGTHAS